MARASKVVAASGTADVAVYTGSGILYGFSARESAVTAAAGSFIIRDGTTVAGDPIMYVNLLSDESAREWYGPQGIPFNTGIFLDREAGTSEVVFYIG